MKRQTQIPYFLLSLFLFLSFSSFSFADQITPNHRVQSHLNVRAEPSAADDIEIIDTLKPGQTAQLLASVPYWYQVWLDDGTVGFVYKAYAKIVTDVASGQVIRVGSWNIMKLGWDNGKDYPKVAEIINANFDLICVVEVMHKKGNGHPGYDSLIQKLGSNWTGMVTDTPRPNTDSGHSEYYAILFRNAIIEPCEGWSDLIYHQDNDGGENGTGDDFFSREPVYGCFASPLNKGTIGVDFIIAAYHAVWAKGVKKTIKAEVKHIDEVFTAMAKAKPDEKDIFIAGDFNLIPTQLRAVVSKEIKTQGTGSTINDKGEKTANLYDHFLVYNESDSGEIVSEPMIIDVRDQVATNKLFYKTISDHLPLVVQISATGADDD
jgi:SH3 domain-containing protein